MCATRLRVSVVRAHRSIGFRFLLFGMGSATYIASRIRNYSSKLELMAPDLHVRVDSGKHRADYAPKVFFIQTARSVSGRAFDVYYKNNIKRQI